ncbi:MAG: DM13 domain-containing protein [Pseudomonadota bacterium]
MWQFVKGFLSGGLIGTVVGLGLGIFLFPYLFPPPDAMETLNRDEAGALVAKGTFIHANPADPVHYGKGSVSVYPSTVFLGEDFEVGPGPDYHVYLVPKSDIRDSSQVKETMFVDLGRLRAFKGSQNYTIPAGVNLKDFPSVVIWCQQFGVLISPADLQFEQTS